MSTSEPRVPAPPPQPTRASEFTGGPGRPARVLFLNDTARNGGPGRSLHSILQFLDPAVVHRAVVLPRPGPISELLEGSGAADALHFVPDLVENPIAPWSRPMERRDFDAPLARKAARAAGNAFKVGRALARLSRLVRRDACDLVYCNGTNADFAGAAVAEMTGVPALWHVRYTSVPLLVRGLHRRLGAAGGVRRILCVSRAAAGLFEHCPDKVRVLHNGVDTAAFAPDRVPRALRAELGLEAGVVVVGSHGRVLRRKGYVEMVRAARGSMDRMTEAERRRVAFVVVGDTPEDFRPDHVEECRALAASYGLGEHFHFLGFRLDVRPLVGDFDVAVVPSVYADPLPRAVLESMALGKPVIAFDVGGVAEMIEPGVTGELVPFEPRDPGSGGPPGCAASESSVALLAAAIVRACRDPGLRERQGRAARARVVDAFDARAHARLVQAEIVAVARRGGGPPR